MMFSVEVIESQMSDRRRDAALARQRQHQRRRHERVDGAPPGRTRSRFFWRAVARA